MEGDQQQKKHAKKIALHQKQAQSRKLTEPEFMLDDFFLEEDTIEDEKRRTREKLGMSPARYKKKPINSYEKLNIDLYKAGLPYAPEQVIRALVYLALGLLVIGGLVIGIVSLLLDFPFLYTIIYLVAWFIIGFFFFYALAIIIFKVYLSYRIFRRRTEVERILPEFLRLVATNYRSGMPLDKAIIKSNRPRFGIFSKELQIVAKTTRVKGDLARSLQIFSKKFNSKILERAINNIVMSIKSGSNISALLEDIASNITKMRNMRSSMAANVKNYVIFIVIAGVIIAPLMFSMSYVMNSTITNVKSNMADQQDLSVQSSITIQSGGGVQTDDFNVFAYLMLVTNSFVSALVISMIKYGNFQEGIRRIPLFLILGIGIYEVGKLALAAVLTIL